MPASPLIIVEGNHIDHFGNLIAVTYVDLRHPSVRSPVPPIVKGCRPEHAIENGSAVKISTPRKFRHQGESLIFDLGEGYFQESETVQEAIDDPNDLERERHWNQSLNRAAELVGFDWKTQTISTHRTVTRTRSFEFSPQGWLFCAAIAPATPAGVAGMVGRSRRRLLPRFADIPPTGVCSCSGEHGCSAVGTAGACFPDDLNPQGLAAFPDRASHADHISRADGVRR